MVTCTKPHSCGQKPGLHSLLFQIVAKGIPMRARRIHTPSGKKYSIPYGKKNQVLELLLRAQGVFVSICISVLWTAWGSWMWERLERMREGDCVEGRVSCLAVQSVLQQSFLNPLFVCLAVHSLCGQSKLKQRAADR